MWSGRGPSALLVGRLRRAFIGLVRLEGPSARNGKKCLRGVFFALHHDEACRQGLEETRPWSSKMPRLFLMRLACVQFPFQVIRPEEVIYASVLKATGLIEAEFNPPLSPNGKYVPTRTAIVICITDEGMAELKRLQDERPRRWNRSARSAPPRSW